MEAPERKKIGRILCETTQLTASQLEQGLRIQENSENEWLGHILLSLADITQQQLDEALEVQSKLAAKELG
jgi:hypothetical protein